MIDQNEQPVIYVSESDAQGNPHDPMESLSCGARLFLTSTQVIFCQDMHVSHSNFNQDPQDAVSAKSA